jgi:hypothetical protein
MPVYMAMPYISVANSLNSLVCPQPPILHIYLDFNVYSRIPLQLRLCVLQRNHISEVFSQNLARLCFVSTHAQIFSRSLPDSWESRR